MCSGAGPGNLVGDSKGILRRRSACALNAAVSARSARDPSLTRRFPHRIGSPLRGAKSLLSVAIGITPGERQHVEYVTESRRERSRVGAWSADWVVMRITSHRGGLCVCRALPGTRSATIGPRRSVRL